jgi:CheY-like chemotaxis protein
MPAKAPAQILIVDDELTTRLVLRHTLEGRGYAVTEAEDGVQAMRLASARRPDCILLDYMMPRLDGIGTLRLIREHRGLRWTPVVVLTAYSDEERREQFARLGASVLMKPFPFEALYAALDRVLLASRRSG